MSDAELLDVDPDDDGNFITSDLAKPFGGMIVDCHGLHDFAKSAGKSISELTEEEIAQFLHPTT